MQLNSIKITLAFLFCVLQFMTKAQAKDHPIYESKAYSIYRDRVEEGQYRATVISPEQLCSDYRSADAGRYSPTVSFKFSINCRDNEMVSGKDHLVTLRPENGACVTQVQFGKQLVQTFPLKEGETLAPNTLWTLRLDMREVMRSFKEKGYYILFNGERLDQGDFKGVYVAGLPAPLIWDFNNLHTRPELQLHDPDGDGIYETQLLMNAKGQEANAVNCWKQVNNTSQFPQLHSDFPISDAVYNLALDEMIKAVEPDSTFRTGKEWAGVWTRDISYSILLSMACVQPKVAMISLMRKVKEGRIIQDTGTGGAYPVSTDRIIWAVAAWELYKVTGDKDWLAKAYGIIKKSVEDDLHNAYDPKTGLVKGESSFLDWREQTYPRWMQPADIFESENLGTNAVHYEANRILAQMAQLLDEPLAATKYDHQAERIKKGINRYLWMKDKGYYGQFLYGRNFQSLSPRAEALGEALCVLFDIAGPKQQQSVVASVPVTDFGIPCIYPQIPGIPPYHNQAVWPFVQSYWAMAAARAGNEQSVMESIAAVYRPAALFLTNKENFVLQTGDFGGTQINSSNMLWSLSGSMALFYKVLFGIDFQADKLVFHPFVPGALSGKRSLTNFKYRAAVLNIEMEGFGSQVKRFELDGKEMPKAAVSCHLTGEHQIRILLAENAFKGAKINKTDCYTTIDTPLAKYADGKLQWGPVEGAVHYEVLKNGKLSQQTKITQLDIAPAGFAEYQVVAVDTKGVPSFASEPVRVADGRYVKHYEMESFASTADYPYKDYHGEGFVEISKLVNRNILMPVDVKKTGTYAISFRYSNGNGPVNTENKCALRTLMADGRKAGTVVLPQRGSGEWSNWGTTNTVHLKLNKGKHELRLSFEPANENMNGAVNQAMLDDMEMVLVNRD